MVGQLVISCSRVTSHSNVFLPSGAAIRRRTRLHVSPGSTEGAVFRAPPTSWELFQEPHAQSCADRSSSAQAIEACVDCTESSRLACLNACAVPRKNQGKVTWSMRVLPRRPALNCASYGYCEWTCDGSFRFGLSRAWKCGSTARVEAQFYSCWLSGGTCY